MKYLIELIDKYTDLMSVSSIYLLFILTYHTYSVDDLLYLLNHFNLLISSS